MALGQQCLCVLIQVNVLLQGSVAQIGIRPCDVINNPVLMCTPTHPRASSSYQPQTVFRNGEQGDSKPEEGSLEMLKD